MKTLLFKTHKSPGLMIPGEVPYWVGKPILRSSLSYQQIARQIANERNMPVEDMELWQSLTATYDAEGEVLATNGVIEDSAPQSFGMVRVTTAGGTAVYPVQYSVH